MLIEAKKLTIEDCYEIYEKYNIYISKFQNPQLAKWLVLSKEE